MPGIDVEIRIEFLEDDAQAAQFEQGAERSRGQAFAERTHHAAGYKNIFHRRDAFRRRARASFRSSAFASSGVSTPGEPFRDEHMNLYTIFKRAQLLERSARSSGDGFQRQTGEGLAPKSVDALVANNRRRDV